MAAALAGAKAGWEVQLMERASTFSEIGAVCGFENNCSFSRAFRERYGTPPSLYRLEAKGGGPAGDMRDVTPDSAQLRGSERKATLAFGT